MDEQNKQPEQNKPEKKLSRTTLTFYIVGLFSVAIALILISYVAQSRADKQVENLSSQLTQQQTVAQGATQKVEDLQKQYDIQNTALDKVRKTLDSEQAATDVVGATEQRMEEREVYQYLAQIGVSLAAKQTARSVCWAAARMALMRTSANCSSRSKLHWSRLSKRRMQSRTTRKNNTYIM